MSIAMGATTEIFFSLMATPPDEASENIIRIVVPAGAKPVSIVGSKNNSKSMTVQLCTRPVYT